MGLSSEEYGVIFLGVGVSETGLEAVGGAGLRGELCPKAVSQGCVSVPFSWRHFIFAKCHLCLGEGERLWLEIGVIKSCDLSTWAQQNRSQNFLS